MSGIAYLVVLLWVVVLFFLGLFGLGQWASRTRPDSPRQNIWSAGSDRRRRHGGWGGGSGCSAGIGCGGGSGCGGDSYGGGSSS